MIDCLHIVRTFNPNDKTLTCKSCGDVSIYNDKHTHDWHMLEWSLEHDSLAYENNGEGGIAWNTGGKATKFICLICDEVKDIDDQPPS